MKNLLRLPALVGGLFICCAAQGASYPLKISATNPRVLADQNNVPFLMAGDSPHSLFSNISSADATDYLRDRAARGINCLWVNLLCVRPIEGRPDGSLIDGTRPFTRTLPGTNFLDLTAPNEAYFAHVDEVARIAAANGIVLMIDPLETAGDPAGPLLRVALANGANRCRAYGQFLGDRYKDYPNVVWLNGNDFQRWNVATNDAVITSVALGIKDKDPNHLHTIELNYQASTSLDDPNWTPIVGLNLAYSYYPTYAEVLHGYNQSADIPVFMGEANFEGETNGNEDGGRPLILRMQEYWTMLSGATGQLYGNRYLWRFLPGWKDHLDSPGIVQFGYMKDLFARRKWYDLAPDQAHEFVISGYGVFAPVPPRHVTPPGTQIADNDYVTAAATRDGSLGMAYLPKGGTITVAMNKLQDRVAARWFDPSVNAFIDIVGSPFNNAGTRQFTTPGANGAGDPDWVLLLEAVHQGEASK